MFTRLSILIVLLVASFSTASGQNCLDYSKPVSLSGTLSSRVFAGPPNYESSKRGDRRETAIILTLAEPVCTNGKPDDVDVPETGVREIQLVLTKPEHWKIVRRRSAKPIMVTGTLFHAHTGHHRTNVLINVTEMNLKQ